VQVVAGCKQSGRCRRTAKELHAAGGLGAVTARRPSVAMEANSIDQRHQKAKEQRKPVATRWGCTRNLADTYDPNACFFTDKYG